MWKYFSQSFYLFQALSMKNLKKKINNKKNITVKDMMTTLVSFYWSVLLGILHVAFSVVRGFYRIFSVAFTNDQVQGAKTIKVTVVANQHYKKHKFCVKYFSIIISNKIKQELYKKNKIKRRISSVLTTARYRVVFKCNYNLKGKISNQHVILYFYW